MHFVIAGGVITASGPCIAQAIVESTDGCVVKQTAKLPSCAQPFTASDRGISVLRSADALIEAQHSAEAVALLTEHLQAVEALDDYGLLVRFRAALGEAFVGVGDLARAETALTRAAQLWSDANSLRWIRSLPSGEVSQLSIMRASDAAAGAVYRLAELQRQRTIRKLPPFDLPEAQYPYIDLADSALTARQKSVRQRYRSRLVESLQRYVDDVMTPWIEDQQQAIVSAQRAYEKVYFVPPVVGPRWRVAVAASVASMWGEYAEAIRNVSTKRDKLAHVEHLERYYSSIGDDPYEGPLAAARRAFEFCVVVSRRYRVLYPQTLVCERWLAQHYRQDYQQLDELFPVPSWLPTNPLAGAAPAARLEVH